MLNRKIILKIYARNAFCFLLNKIIQGVLNFKILHTHCFCTDVWVPEICCVHAMTCEHVIQGSNVQ